MADTNEVIDLCGTPGQRSEASGPPVKRFRGVDSAEEGPHGGPSHFDEGGLQLEGPSSQHGSAQHAPSPSLSLGRPPSSIRNLSPSRLAPGQVGPLNTGLWVEPQQMPVTEATSSGIDLGMDSSNQAPQLHWARKSQRQNRSTQRQHLGNPSDHRPDVGFPSRLAPPNYHWVPPEHHRMPPLLGMGRGPMDRGPREGQAPGARRMRRMEMYPFDYEMDDIELFDGIESLEPGEFNVGVNPGPGPNLVGEPDPSRVNGRRSSRRFRLSRDSEGSRLRSFLPRFAPIQRDSARAGISGLSEFRQRLTDEILDEIDDSQGTPQRDFTGMGAMRERIRQLESRRVAREQAREQTREAFMRRRPRNQGPREGRGASLRAEFGALMNVLGLVSPLDGAPGNAMMGMARSGLPPHLLFTDRDFTGEDYEFLCRLDEGVENRKGADDDTINKLQSKEFEDETAPATLAEVEEPCNRCPICLEEFCKGDAMRIMPCPHRHAYHKDCLDTWLRIKAVCPICNFSIREDS